MRAKIEIKTETEVYVSIEIRVQEIAKVGTGVVLLSIKAPPALWQVWGPAI